MIEITVGKKSDYIREVKVQGHGGDVKGRDIVCAAVSAVTQTALSGLLYYGRDNVTWNMKKGTLWVKIRKGTDRNKQEIFNIILSTMIIGLRKIVEEYPHRITIRMVESE